MAKVAAKVQPMAKVAAKVQPMAKVAAKVQHPPKPKPLAKVVHPAIAEANKKLKVLGKQMKTAADGATHNTAPAAGLHRAANAATSELRKVEDTTKKAAEEGRTNYAAKLGAELSSEKQAKLAQTAKSLAAAKQALAAKEDRLESASAQLQRLSKLQSAAAAALAASHPVDPMMPSPEEVKAAATKEAAEKAKSSKAAARHQQKVSKEAAMWAAKMSADELDMKHQKRRETQRLKNRKEAMQLMHDSSQVYSHSGGEVSSATSKLSQMATAMYGDVRQQVQIADASERQYKANHVPPPPPLQVTPKALSEEAKDQVAELVNATCNMVNLIKSPDRGYAGSIGVSAVRIADRAERLSQMLDLGRRTMKHGVEDDKWKEADQVLRIVGADVDPVGDLPVVKHPERTPAVATPSVNTDHGLEDWGVGQPAAGAGVAQVAAPPEAPPGAMGGSPGVFMASSVPVVSQYPPSRFVEDDGGLFAP